MINTQKLFVPLLMTGTLLYSTASIANTRPIAEKQHITMAEDSNTAITLAASDALTYKIVRKPRKGTLSEVSEGIYTYAPKANFNGRDRFLFRVNDGQTSSRLAVVKITVTDVEDGLVAQDISINGKEGTTSRVTLQGSGGSILGMTYSINTVPENGVVTIRRNKALYKPTAYFNGTDSFTYLVSDGTTSSSPATVTIEVAAVNNRPTAENIALDLVKDSVKKITLNGSDIEDTGVIYEIIRKPRKGTLSDLTEGSLEYTPKSAFTGRDSFSYRLVDTEGQRSRIARVKLKVLDHIPTAENLTLEVTENTVKQITLKGDDITDDNATLVYEITSQPIHGMLGTLTGATLAYTPTEGYTGEDSFTYQVINSEGAISAISEVNLTIIDNLIQEYVFNDTPADDLNGTELRDFLQGVDVNLVSYIYVEGNVLDSRGAWCSVNADFYVNNYLNRAFGGSVINSGGWNKWAKRNGSGWIQDNTPRENLYGYSCGGGIGDWCSEWGIGGNHIGYLPVWNQSSSIEIINGIQSDTGRFILRVAPTRLAACGF